MRKRGGKKFQGSETVAGNYDGFKAISKSSGPEHLQGMKMDLKRKEARLARTVGAIAVASKPAKKHLLAPQCRYLLDQIEDLEAAIMKATASRMVRGK